jgi:DNA (cytosine-5)-methyltransferase 1
VNELALFAGAGGGLLASKLLGWNTICAVEIEKYPRDVLLARQRDGQLERFPIWDDVRTFDGKPWRDKVDIITGGFPCQDISAAGTGKGLAGTRSGLWKEYARIIGEVQPEFAFIENSPMLRTRGLGTVLQDLTKMGYDARWCVLGAWHVAANHVRDRMWILAYPMCKGLERQRKGTCRISATHKEISRNLWWQSEPNGIRVDDGLAYRVDRIKALGNGQVPLVAATAFKLLSEGLI